MQSNTQVIEEIEWLPPMLCEQPKPEPPEHPKPDPLPPEPEPPPEMPPPDIVPVPKLPDQRPGNTLPEGADV